MKNTIPRRLQGTLWSVSTKHLDLQKDKVYIIHQILSYGTIDEIRWLLKTYGKEQIIDVFLNHPYKDYSSSRFLFVKNFLLNYRSPLNERQYVRNTPRDIR